MSEENRAPMTGREVPGDGRAPGGGRRLGRSTLRAEVAVVGAGLAGLACARELLRNGVEPLVLEAGDGVGGRVRTDRVEGFLLDRGYQVMLPAYPEARRVLDLEALELRPFVGGALVKLRRGFRRVVDPVGHPGDVARRPLATARSALGPPGGVADRFRLLGLVRRLRRTSLEEIFRAPESTSWSYLRDAGFSAPFVHGFLRPFLGGVFLDPALETSSRMLEFTLKMFVEGGAALPADGMEAVPSQLARTLPPDAVRTGVRVSALEPGAVCLSGGGRVAADAVVVAADGPAASGLLGEPWLRGARTTRCVYFAAESPPVEEGILVLDGEGGGPVNHLAVPSLVAPGYAPPGAHLVSANVLGGPGAVPDDELVASVREQLAGWFGSRVRGWRHLRTYRILHALPGQRPGEGGVADRGVRLRPGLYVAGDHRFHASIQGALASGRRAAEALLADRAAGKLPNPAGSRTGRPITGAAAP